jgi:hypothetical protein
MRVCITYTNKDRHAPACPGIHVFLSIGEKLVDGPTKSGHDV